MHATAAVNEPSALSDANPATAGCAPSASVAHVPNAARPSPSRSSSPKMCKTPPPEHSPLTPYGRGMSFLALTARPSRVIVTSSEPMGEVGSPVPVAPARPGPGPGRGRTGVAGTVGSSNCRAPRQAIGRERAAAQTYVLQELVPEHPYARGHRAGYRRAKGADGGLSRRPGNARDDVVADVAADIGPGPGVHDDIDRKAGAENVGPGQAEARRKDPWPGLGATCRTRPGLPAHRSASPITGSIEEMMATRSAMRPPCAIGARPWRFANDGARMCMR